MQLFLNILHDLRGSRGRECKGSHPGKRIRVPLLFAGTGTKIIPPLRDTMSFIHGNQTHVHQPQFFPEPFRVQSLGRHVQELNRIIYTLINDRLHGHASSPCRSPRPESPCSSNPPPDPSSGQSRASPPDRRPPSLARTPGT